MFTAKVPETRGFEQFFGELSEELTSIKQKCPPCGSGYFMELEIY